MNEINKLNPCGFEITNYPFIEKDFDSMNEYEAISQLNEKVDCVISETNTAISETKNSITVGDNATLIEAKNYTDSHISSDVFNVEIVKDGFGNYTADYNDNDINNARNSGKLVQAKYSDETNNQTYTYYYSTMNADRRPSFNRTFIEDNKIVQIIATVSHDKRVTIERKEV